MSKVLICEDDRVARDLLEEILRREGYDVLAVDSGQGALELLDGPAVDLVISDVRLGDGPTGMDVLSASQKKWPETPVLLITGFGDVTGAMAAIQKGAYDYVSKPFNVAELTTTVRRALERSRLRDESRALRKQSTEPEYRIESIVGRSTAMLDVYKMVARVAPTLSTVLVVGESGTGKELVARAIHNHSARAQGPFVAVNCTALAESLLESERFGPANGAFTGAVGPRRGLVAEAQGGTLFLDEIGDVPAKMQAQLLRVLQEGEIRRVGGNEAVKVDVRVVAATNKELEEEIRAGRFREDLYFRLNVVTIRLPPLRDRPSDIPILVRHFLAKYAAREKRPHFDIASEAQTALEQHGWPGNVRELENVIERAVALAKDGIVLQSDLPREIDPTPEVAAAGESSAAVDVIAGRPTLAELERRYIELILAETGGNKKRAAEILGIDRRTLYRTLDREAAERDAERDKDDKDVKDDGE